MTAYVHTSTRICRVLIGLAILRGIIGLAAKSGYTGIQEGVSAYRRGDYATALQEWLPLAQQGNTAAQYNLGLLYEYGYGVLQDYQQAAQWFRRAAEQGNARAQAALGWLYEYGDGVPQDYQQAVQWYRWAAEQGNAVGQTHLGSMYEYGKGVPKDYEQAIQWFRRAVEQGNPWAQYNLGSMYEYGKGVPKDDIQAHMWYNLAAAHSSPSGFDYVVHKVAGVGRDYVARRLTPTQLAEAQTRAHRWQPKPEPQALPSPQQSIPSQASPRRALVRQVQTRLQAEGFTPGTLDGTLGPQTQQALRWFQNARGLLATGDLDSPTLDALDVR